MMPEKIRVGIIGAGQNTRKMHLPKLMALSGVEIREVANRTQASGQKAADEFGIPTVKSDWREVATSPDVDAVVIGTWPYLHCEATCLSLQAGKHVLCEARMAMNEAEARKMLEISRQHPDQVAQLVPAPFTLRLDKTISDFISRGHLGRLLHFQADWQSAALAPPGGTLHWRRNIKYSGVNTMVLGIVYESILRWLPQAAWVSAVGSVFNDTAIDPDTRQPVTVEIPDYLSVQTRLQNGMCGTLLLSEAGAHAGPPSIRIFGEEGTLHLEFALDGKLWFGSTANGKLREVEIAPENEGRWRVEEEFINAIRGKEKIRLTSFETGVEYMKFTEAVIRSYRNNGTGIDL